MRTNAVWLLLQKSRYVRFLSTNILYNTALKCSELQTAVKMVLETQVRSGASITQTMFESVGRYCKPVIINHERNR